MEEVLTLVAKLFEEIPFIPTQAGISQVASGLYWTPACAEGSVIEEELSGSRRFALADSRMTGGGAGT